LDALIKAPWQEVAALRDHDPAYVGCGSFATEEVEPARRLCPLHPESGQI